MNAQKRCGSCWAFTATAAIEALHKIDNGQLVALSEQQLVDCSDGDGCEGSAFLPGPSSRPCTGWYGQAFVYVVDNGIATSADYAYTGTAGICAEVTGTTKIGDFEDLPKNDEAAMLRAVDRQPVATAMHMLVRSWSVMHDDVQDDLRTYAGGVYARKDCPDKLKYLNHSVLVVGYGADANGKYWIVRNSWGGGWGDNGYMLVQRGVNMCGIEHAAAVPTL